MVAFVRNCLVKMTVLVNFCCYEYGANAEIIQKISTRTLLAGVMSTHTKTANFKAKPMEKHM